jgi:WD40 repeat protein
LLGCPAGKLELLSEKTNAHSGDINSVAFSRDGTKIVSSGSWDRTIKVWDADSFNLLETHPGAAMAFSKEAEGVVRDGATIRMKEGGGAFYAPSPILCVAVSWPRIAAGAHSGELYHLEVMM